MEQQSSASLVRPSARARELYALMQARGHEARRVDYETCMAVMSETLYFYGPSDTSDLFACEWITPDGSGGWLLLNG